MQLSRSSNLFNSLYGWQFENTRDLLSRPHQSRSLDQGNHAFSLL
jgi:hypothetical protein